MKKKPPFNENAAIRGAIRRVFARSPIVREVLMEGRREVPKYNKDGSRAKKDAVQYHCQVCLNWVSSTKVAIDHIEPVISVDDGFVDWNTFVDRIGFNRKENLQRICDDCHQKKTNKERWERILKKDIAHLELVEASDYTPTQLKEQLKIFNKKKMETYPRDLVDRILKLKALAAKGKKGK